MNRNRLGDSFYVIEHKFIEKPTIEIVSFKLSIWDCVPIGRLSDIVGQ